MKADILIVGSGPVGSAFAREIWELKEQQGKDLSIIMVDAGDQLSRRPGEHLKNAFVYQRDYNAFTGLISSHLFDLSIATDNRPVITLDPTAFSVDLTSNKYKGFIRNNQNPYQNPFKNVDGAAAAFNVGGMAVHWTCAIPRQNSEIEQSNLIRPNEWNLLYDRAEELLALDKNNEVFKDSIRNMLVLHEIKQAFPGRGVRDLPLAVQPNLTDSTQVIWSGGDTVLGEDLVQIVEQDQPNARFQILPHHLCTELCHDHTDDSKIAVAHCRDLSKSKEEGQVSIFADKFIIAAGAVLTPQLLYNSDIRPPALGRHLCEQPKTFCQIVLKEKFIKQLRKRKFPELTSEMEQAIDKHEQKYPNDPIPIPFQDLAPQVNIPVTKDHPWHCQIHRDAFKYGAVPENVDDRIIVDLRWFGLIEPRYSNRVKFEDDKSDIHGLPQPTFEFELTPDDSKHAHKMMSDMVNAAVVLGGFLPGSEPRFMPIGSSLHITGTIRMGPDTDTNSETSVVDTYGAVRGKSNLWLGGNGVIDKGTACNPTLTSVALAVRSSRKIMGLPDLSGSA